MKFKVLYPQQEMQEDTGGEGHVVSCFKEQEYEVENREQVRFTTDPDALQDGDVKVLVNPNFAAAVDFTQSED